MRRALAIALALCCVLALVTLGASASRPQEGPRVGSAAPVTPATNTTSFLLISPDALETTAYRDATIDVAATVGFETTRLDGQFRQALLDERFSATDSMPARRDRIEATAARIDGRIAALVERQAATVAAYNNGSLSGHEFLRELAHIDVAAGRLEAAVDRVAELAGQSSIEGLPAGSWARNQALRLDPLRGPARARIAGAFRGENTVSVDDVPTGVAAIGQIREERLTPLSVYVETTREGITLATVDEGRYYREAYLPGERNATEDGVDAVTDVRDRRAALYPWAENNSEFKSQRNVRRAGISRFRSSHHHGRLTAYLDQDSGGVFAEHQRKTLAQLPTVAPVNAIAEDRRLLVNRTHPTGPLELRLTNRSGGPLDGTVLLDNRSIGRTGTDGHHWTVAPRGNVTVAARANGAVVRLETTAAVATNRSARRSVPASS